jgi:hypothetical protein
MYTILFPCHEVNNKLPDELYKEEFEAAILQDFRVVLFDYDRFVRDSEIILNNESGSDIQQTDFIGPMIYRGYMLKDTQYELLYNWLLPKYKLINSPKEYSQCHYLPEVYEYIKEYTSKSVWFTEITLENITNALSQLNSNLIFLKDFVKSAKESSDFVLLESKDPKTWFAIIENFIKYRGKLFNKGIVLKEWLDVKKYNQSQVNEWRCVFMNKRLVSMSQNSNLNNASKPGISWLFLIASTIPSNFLTIDIIETNEGNWSIVETGDGQVSGLSPNQNILVYYSKINLISLEM